MVLADRTRAVARAVEAAVAHDVLARIEDVGRSTLHARQARPVVGLKEVHEDLGPVELFRVARDALREFAKQWFVLLVATGQREQRCECPGAKAGELVE